ncbi:Sorbin and SH3 domain-containing protein 2, partial [Modicella reniformis]
MQPRLFGSVSGTSNGGGGNFGTIASTSSPATSGPSGGFVFYNIHQPSARSPLSQETTPFGLFRQKNHSTSALPTAQSPATGSSSNLVLAPVTTASSASAFSPNSSYTNLLEAFNHNNNNNSNQKDTDSIPRTTIAYSPSTQVLPPLLPITKLNTLASSPKISAVRPPSFQYVTQYYAWWDYIARDHDELSFKKGDTLRVNREFDDLWCLGSVVKPDKRTRHGFFPLQYCSTDGHCYIPSPKVSARSGAAPGTEPGCRLNIVHPHSANSQDELNLRPGNQVRLLHIFDDGWLLGEQIDHAGMLLSVGAFPAAVAKPITVAEVGMGGGATSMSSPSKQRHVGSPLVPTQDVGLIKARQREESFSSNTSNYNTLYSHQNSSNHMLQYSLNNGSTSNISTMSSGSTMKLPGSPTSSPYITGQQNYRASPPIIPTRSPHSGADTLRTASHQNRTSVQSTASSNDGRRGGGAGGDRNNANTPMVTEDQVIRALQERPAQDAVLQQYLAQRGDPNIVDVNGNSLLHLAIVAHSQASLVFLLNMPDIRLEYGSPISPLYTAVRFRSWKAAQQLLIQGADPNVHDERGVSVLHVVLLFMTKGDSLAEEVVHLLCDNKADVNCIAQDKKVIPLAIAVERELWAEAEILLAYGANPYLIWGRDKRQSAGMIQGGIGEATLINGILPNPGYYNDPLWEAVNDDKVHLVRLLLKFYYAPTSFVATAAPPPPPPPLPPLIGPLVAPPGPSSPSPSPSSTQSSQSFFAPQHSFLHHSSASSYTTNNGSSGNINIPILPHGGSVPMPFAAGNGAVAGGHGTPPSIPSPSSAQSSPGSAALVG